MTEFSTQDLKNITDTQKLVKDLQQKQQSAFDVLVMNLPALKKQEESLL